jgi:hypothetical protein
VVTLLSGNATARTGYKRDTGANPAVAVNPSGQVVEVHQAGSGSNLWSRVGHLDAAGRTVNVLTSGGTLSVATDRTAAARIRFPQAAFVEYQPGDSAELEDGSLFRAATASNKSFIVSARQAGVSARGWDFDSASLATDLIASYPATNNPGAAWYLSMLNRPDVVS